MKKYVLNLIFLLLLSGCAQLKPTPQPLTLAWPERQQTLTRMQNWTLQGAIAIRTSRDSATASLRWQQHAQAYQLTLMGPFGMNAIQVFGKPGEVQLYTAEGKFFASNPEQLLRNQLGWQLPVSNLYYWVRGLPVPQLHSQIKLDAHQRLLYLSQQDWQIWFKQYQYLHQRELPTKIILIHPALQIKLVIYQWKE